MLQRWPWHDRANRARVRQKACKLCLDASLAFRKTLGSPRISARRSSRGLHALPAHSQVEALQRHLFAAVKSKCASPVRARPPNRLALLLLRRTRSARGASTRARRAPSRGNERFEQRSERAIVNAGLDNIASMASRPSRADTPRRWRGRRLWCKISSRVRDYGRRTNAGTWTPR